MYMDGGDIVWAALVAVAVGLGGWIVMPHRQQTDVADWCQLWRCIF